MHTVFCGCLLVLMCYIAPNSQAKILQWQISSLPLVYIWLESLSHMNILCLVFLGMAKLFSNMAAAFYNPNGNG